METWDSAEVLSPEQMKISGIGMSRCVFTKKYHPDGTFDKKALYEILGYLEISNFLSYGYLIKLCGKMLEMMN